MGNHCSEGKGHGVHQNHNQLKGQSGIKRTANWVLERVWL